MPFGFRGNAAEAYLQAVEDALTAAAVVHTKNPFSATSNFIVPLPILEPRSNKTTPHSPSTAHSGGNSSGTGSSENLVVDDERYCSFLQEIIRADNDIATKLYGIADGIDRLCDESFCVPLTTQECRIIALGVRNSMVEFHDLTVGGDTKMRSFINNMLSIGGDG